MHTLLSVMSRIVMGIGVLIMAGSLMITPAAQAALTAQGVTGTVDAAEEIAQEWQPLADAMDVEAGHIVRTDMSSLTNLQGNDGSLFSLGEITQLLVREYEFSPDQETRIVRCSILEGLVTAEAAHLAYATNIFDIETPSVTASFKFSKASFQVDQKGNTAVTLFTGKFDLIAKPGFKGSTRAKHQTEDGVVTEMTFSGEAGVNVETTSDGLKMANIGSIPLQITVGGQNVELSPGASIQLAMTNGQPAITNTSTTEGAEVNVNGVQVSASGTLTLAQTTVQSPATSGGQLATTPTGAQPGTPAAGATPDTTVITVTFQTINTGSTSSAVPTSGSTTGSPVGEGPAPGERPAQTQKVQIPVTVVEQ